MDLRCQYFDPFAFPVKREAHGGEAVERREAVHPAVQRVAAHSAIAAGVALRWHPLGRRDLAALLRHSRIGTPRE